MDTTIAKPLWSLFVLIVLCACTNSKKEKMKILVQSDHKIFVQTPVEVFLEDRIKGLLSQEMSLVKMVHGKEMRVPFQIDSSGGNKKLYFLQKPSEGPPDKATYFLKIQDSNVASQSGGVSLAKSDGNLNLDLNEKSVLTYRYKMHYPPDEVDSIFGKSGYIHPLLTPKGDTLTRINPPDHYHHYGIWGPWTHTRIKGQRVDFWNMVEGRGTVLFKKFNVLSSGSVFADFEAAQEHIDRITEKESQIALNENLKVVLWDLGRPDRYMFDYTTTFSTPLEEGVLFEAYRYGGGIGMRFTERWRADNCSVLTSEGKDRSTADGTNARWCIVSGASTDGNKEGILFMSHPENRAHPEPMRVWPLDANRGRGDMFFEFCPIRHKEWKIEPHTDYQLKYRMVVFDGELTSKEAEGYWQAFAHPPIAKIISY